MTRMPAIVWVCEETVGEAAVWVPSSGLFVAAILREYCICSRVLSMVNCCALVDYVTVVRSAIGDYESAEGPKTPGRGKCSRQKRNIIRMLRRFFGD